MTVRPKSLVERFQVFVDFSNGGGDSVLINSYRHRELAEKCCTTLNADVPGSFVEKAWMVDTQEERGVGVSEEWLRQHQENPRYHGSRVK